LLSNSLDIPEVIIITEAKPKRFCGVTSSEFSLPYYKTYTNDFQDINRGIIIYVKSSFKCDQVIYNNFFSEYLIIKIHSEDIQNKFVIGCVYRSPSSSPENDDCLQELINSLFSFNNNNCRNNTVVIGDFNYPSIDWDRWVCVENKSSSSKFLETLMDNFLIQNVSYPTRARSSDTPHILDLVLTADDIVSDITHMSPLGNSDHSILDIKCDFNCHSNVSTLNKFDFSKGNFAGLMQSLSIDWDSFFADCVNDIELMWSKFRHFLYKKTEEFVPKVNNFNIWKKSSWSRPLSKNLRKIIRQKHRAWNRYVETKDPVKLIKYKQIRNAVASEINSLRAQEQYEISISSKENPKKFWKYINSKRKSNCDIGDLKYTDERGHEITVSNDRLKAEVLCKSFSSVFTSESAFNSIDFNINNNNISNMEGLKLDPSDILTRLTKLNVNKSAGPDDIYPRILYEAREQLVYPLKILFETSINSKQLPEDWRTANVVPVFKKGDKKHPLNYRPISLTSIACKMLESIVRDHIMFHFLDNQLFSTQQYGFLKGRNAVIQLIKMFDNWTEALEEGGQIDVIYTDFEKAFDKVPHKRLLLKLKHYNVNPDIIDWIQSFLTNRKQRVKLNNNFSSWCAVLSGIPQGSFLGPLLFIIFINDLPDVCKEINNIFLYADDAKFCRHIKTYIDNATLQDTINNLQSWTDKWQLNLNIDKCVTVSYGRQVDTSHSYNINREGTVSTLVRLNSYKDLGVIFQSDMSFKEHIASQINKANSMLGLIKRNFRDIKQDAFIMLYKSLVRSHLEYANSVWSPYRIQDIEALEKVQKRATKLITSFKHKSYEERLRILNLPTLKFRRIRGDMIEVFKIITGKYDSLISPHLPLSSSSVTRGNSFKIITRRCRYDLRKYSFCNRITNIWNSLPNDVVNASSLNVFKNRLDNHWINQDAMYDWHADISGTGSRSNIVS